MIHCPLPCFNVIHILIFGVSSRNLRKITFKTLHGRFVHTDWWDGSVRKLNRCPKVGNSNKSWKHRKINMEPENDGLEDDFPFQLGVFSGSMLIFRGVCFHAILVVLGWHLSFPSSSQVQAFYLYLMKQRGASAASAPRAWGQIWVVSFFWRHIYIYPIVSCYSSENVTSFEWNEKNTKIYI